MDLARGVKHGLDRVVASALLVLLAPFFALVAIAIRLDSRGNPFFLQERAGAGGRPFTIFKFRTMRQGSESTGLGARTASDDDRITRVGRWLRATSLDELPQLINIALGEMSFVGPRPTLRYQIEAYSARQRRRLLFRPGITGWAQVHGRNEIPWEQRIELDLQYIDRYSLGLDARIVLRTIRVLFSGSGVYAPGGANDAFASPAARATAVPVTAAPAPPVTTAVAAPAATPVAATTPFVADAVALSADRLRLGVPARLPLLLVGAGGHARVVIDIIEKQGRYHIVGLLDESPQMAGGSLMGYPVWGGREGLDRADLPAHAFVAIGAPLARLTWQEALEDRGFQLAVLVHPSAQIGRDVGLGAGTVLMAGAIVNSGSRLERGVIVNTAASIDHDCRIGEFVHVAPGARLAGGVQVGARAHIGIGACVLQNLEIGAGAIVGGGAAVVRAVPAQTTVGGVPARPLRTSSSAPDAGRPPRSAVRTSV